MKNNLDKTNLEITQKLEQQEREKYTKRYNNLNYVDFSNPNADKISSASTTTIKQETLEEVAYNYAEDKTNRTSHLIGFRNGAKWQQQQNKNLYSEEDLEKAFNVGRLYQGREGDTTFKEWFQQFKKK